MLGVPDRELVAKEGGLVHDYGVNAQKAGSFVEFGDVFADYGGGFEVGEDLIEVMVFGCGHLRLWKSMFRLAPPRAC